MQFCPGLQALPQPPQFFGSLSTSTQALLQSLVSPPHAQAALRHEAPAPHDFPQPPQLEGSVLVSVQVEPHSASPVGQMQLAF
jgi:hypothetical protein